MKKLVQVTLFAFGVMLGVMSFKALHAAVRGVAPLTVLANPVAITTTTLIAGGTKFAAAGCANSATVGGATAGQFASGTTGACTVTITLPTAPNGWTCSGSDINTGTALGQNASSTTSCGVTVTTTSGDVVHFMAIGY